MPQEKSRNQAASLCFSDDSRWLVVTYYNGQVLAWDVSDESPEVDHETPNKDLK